MLNINNHPDILKMKNYYRTSDMINLIEYFPDISPVRNLTIIEDENDFITHQEKIKMLDNNRVDSLKGRPVITGVENSGKKEEFLQTLKRVKEKDPKGVLVLFSLTNEPSQRYERYAGISVGVDVSECVYIDAVGRGFDGREVSKGISIHERYYIPWFDLRKCSIENFKNYQTFQISDEEYIKSRNDRITFLKSVGLDEEVFKKYIPEHYEPIPDFIWLSVIKGILKTLEKKEDILLKNGFTHFAISGHTEGRKFSPWQMFDKSRYSVKSKCNK